MNAAPISPALLTTAANQFDVRVDPSPTPSPQVEATVFQAIVFHWDLSWNELDSDLLNITLVDQVEQRVEQVRASDQDEH